MELVHENWLYPILSLKYQKPVFPKQQTTAMYNSILLNLPVDLL